MPDQFRSGLLCTILCRSVRRHQFLHLGQRLGLLCCRRCREHRHQGFPDRVCRQHRATRLDGARAAGFFRFRELCSVTRRYRVWPLSHLFVDSDSPFSTRKETILSLLDPVHAGFDQRRSDDFEEKFHGDVCFKLGALLGSLWFTTLDFNDYRRVLLASQPTPSKTLTVKLFDQPADSDQPQPASVSAQDKKAVNIEISPLAPGRPQAAGEPKPSEVLPSLSTPFQVVLEPILPAASSSSEARPASPASTVSPANTAT